MTQLRSLCCVVLLSLAFAVSDAADCTAAQISALAALRSNVTAVCGSDALSSTTLTSTAYCDDTSCLAYLTSMVSSVPSCEVESYNLRSVVSTAISSCDAASDAVPASKSSGQMPPLQPAGLLLAAIVFLATIY